MLLDCLQAGVVLPEGGVTLPPLIPTDPVRGAGDGLLCLPATDAPAATKLPGEVVLLKFPIADTPGRRCASADPFKRNAPDADVDESLQPTAKDSGRGKCIGRRTEPSVT